MMSKNTLLSALTSCVLMGSMAQSFSQVTVEVDPSESWQGFMNVSNLPQDGGAYQFGSAWGTEDLTAVFTPGVLTLGPNTIDDPAEYWYIGGGGPGAQGNKIMEANMYVEKTGPLSGTTITFSGTVLDNTLTSAHTAIAFIKDFAPDYSSFEVASVPLTPGPFSFDLATIDDPARHVQFGFTMTGENVWITDVDPFGTVTIAVVPEPGTFALAGLGIAAIMLFRHRR